MSETHRAASRYLLASAILQFHVAWNNDISWSGAVNKHWSAFTYTVGG